MKNHTQPINNIHVRRDPTDPVLEVEQWKDAVDEKTKGMTAEELKQYYVEALKFLTQPHVA